MTAAVLDLLCLSLLNRDCRRWRCGASVICVAAIHGRNAIGVCTAAAVARSTAAGKSGRNTREEHQARDRIAQPWPSVS